MNIRAASVTTVHTCPENYVLLGNPFICTNFRETIIIGHHIDKNQWTEVVIIWVHDNIVNNIYLRVNSMSL